MGIAHLPEPIPIRAHVDDLPYPKVILYRASQLGQNGYMVGVLSKELMFFTSLEDTFRKAIHLMEMEARDIIVLDTVPGVDPEL